MMKKMEGWLAEAQRNEGEEGLLKVVSSKCRMKPMQGFALLGWRWEEVSQRQPRTMERLVFRVVEGGAQGEGKVFGGGVAPFGQLTSLRRVKANQGRPNSTHSRWWKEEEKGRRPWSSQRLRRMTMRQKAHSISLISKVTTRSIDQGIYRREGQHLGLHLRVYWPKMQC